MDHDTYLAALLAVAARADRDGDGELTDRGRAQLAALGEALGEAGDGDDLS